ncbi:hypothetical protein EBT23_06615 [bacterium]|nr:hypothetical protein [bacterium]
MAFSKASFRVVGLFLGTICLQGCGPDPRTRFMSEVEGMIQKANEGKHGELEEKLSAPLVERIRAEGWEPKTALVMVARKDREEAARYRLSDVPRFEAKDYAEAEVFRADRAGERRITVPFLWEQGQWKAGTAYKDGRAWEENEISR